MRYFIVFLVLLVGSCTTTDDKKHIADSIANADSLAKAIIKKDTFQSIDEIVLSIRAKLKNKELIEKQDGKWPGVVAYYYPDKTFALITSSEEGEFGRIETESFFVNDELLYTKYRDYYFLPNAQGEIVSGPGTLKAEKIYYMSEGPLAKDSITVYNEDVKFTKGGYNSSKDELPDSHEIVVRIFQMKATF